MRGSIEYDTKVVIFFVRRGMYCGKKCVDLRKIYGRHRNKMPTAGVYINEV